MRRVVVTGLGPVTPIGVGKDDLFEGWTNRRSGVRHITQFDASSLPVRFAGEVDIEGEDWLERRELFGVDRFTLLSAAATELALCDSGLNLNTTDRSRVGTIISTGVGGVGTWEDSSWGMWDKGVRSLSPRFIPKAMANNAAAFISIKHGFTGPSSVPVLACASGAEALVAGYQAVVCDEVDVVLAGGAEAPITSSVMGGFARMHALSRRNETPRTASRPFSRDRDGFVAAEGAGLLVLESLEHAERRGARIYAELAGYGRSSDAFHITLPSPEGEGVKQAIRRAMQTACVMPEDVSYINAHGTSTKFNDLSEVKALKAVLGEHSARVPVSSTKSMTGHTIGAAGAIEAIISVQVVQYGMLPPTINLDEPDPDLALDFVVDGPRRADVTTVLSNSMAFGGHNVVLAFTRV